MEAIANGGQENEVGSKRKKREVTHQIKQWRKYRGMTLDELAAQCGLTGSLISQIELGRSRYSQKSLEAMAKALDCTTGQLLDVDPLATNTTLPLASSDYHRELWESFAPEHREKVKELLRNAEEGALKSARMLYGWVPSKPHTE
jgi:transcriptional regulator with XRE-family HTH domain